MSLSEAQKKLMEEKRLQALQIRASRQQTEKVRNLDHAQQFTSPPSSSKKHVNDQKKETSNNYYNFSPKQSFVNKQCGIASTNQPVSKFTKPQASQHSSAGLVKIKPSLSFQLINRNRFVVEATFSNEIIEIFKKIPSRSYDAQTRKWSFALNDHQKLFEALNPYLAQYQIKPLPNFVINIFRLAF